MKRKFYDFIKRGNENEITAYHSKTFKDRKIIRKIVFIVSVIGFCGCIAGLVSVQLGSGGVTKIGGVTLHSLIDGDYGYNIKSIAAALSGWLVICAGEAVLAKFAETYFKNELKAGTPFTSTGAKELMRLGVLTIVIPVVSAAVGSMAEEIMVGFLKIEKAAALDLYFNHETSVMLGIMLIIGALLCRCGAELMQQKENDGSELPNA